MDVLAADIPAGRRGWGLRIRRYWWVIALAVALGAWGARYDLSMTPKQYMSTSTVSIRLPTQVTAQPQLTQLAMDNELQWAQTLPVARLADQLLGLDLDPEVVRARVAVAQPPNAQLVTFAYSGDSPTAARLGADAFAQAFVDVRDWPRQIGQARRERELDAQMATTQGQLSRYSAELGVVSSTDPRHVNALEQLAILGGDASTIDGERASLGDDSAPVAQVVGEATVPTEPSDPVVTLVAGIGLTLGLMLGLGLAIALAWRDRRLHRPSDVTTWAGLPLLGAIAARRRGRRPLGVANDQDTRAGLDRLRRQVMHAMGPTGRGVVAVTEPSPSAAPCFTAMNLVAAAARLSVPVVLVCADPASPTPSVLGIGATSGLAEVLNATVIADSVRATCAALGNGWVVAPGADLADALQEAPSARLPRYLRALVDQGFLVVLETAPATPGVTGLAVARLADRTVLVAELALTRIPVLRAAARELELAGASLLGVLSVARIGRTAGQAVPALSALAKGSARLG